MVSYVVYDMREKRRGHRAVRVRGGLRAEGKAEHLRLSKLGLEIVWMWERCSLMGANDLRLRR
jgi:hypothetical protein